MMMGPTTMDAVVPVPSDKIPLDFTVVSLPGKVYPERPPHAEMSMWLVDRIAGECADPPRDMCEVTWSKSTLISDNELLLKAGGEVVHEGFLCSIFLVAICYGPISWRLLVSIAV